MDNSTFSNLTPNEEGNFTLSQEQLSALIQSEGDKRVTQALKTANQKKEAEIKEAQKLAAMNEQEKFQYQLEQRESAIKEKELALTMAENKIAGLEILAEKGLSASFIDLVIDGKAEVMNERIGAIDKIFKDAVKSEVEKRIGGNAPQMKTQSGTISKESFKKMSLAEQQNLYMTNPELYSSLTN